MRERKEQFGLEYQLIPESTCLGVTMFFRKASSLNAFRTQTGFKK